MIKQEVNFFYVRDLFEVFGICNEFIKQGHKIVSVCFDGSSQPKEALIIHEEGELPAT